MQHVLPCARVERFHRHTAPPIHALLACTQAPCRRKQVCLRPSTPCVRGVSREQELPNHNSRAGIPKHLFYLKIRIILASAPPAIVRMYQLVVCALQRAGGCPPSVQKVRVCCVCMQTAVSPGRQLSVKINITITAKIVCHLKTRHRMSGSHKTKEEAPD